MTPKETRSYSMVKAIAELADRQNGGVLTGMELEMHQECARSAPTPAKGFFVPYEVATRDINVNGPGGGDAGNTVATEIGDLIDLLRDALVIERLGATRLSGLSSDVQLPRHTATATSAWDAETGALAESSQTFDTITLSPKRAGVQTYYSTQLLIQSSLDIESFVRNDQANGLARTIQNGVLYGLGSSDDPTGLVTTVLASGNTFTFGGAATYADYVNAWELVASDNAAMGRLGYLTTPAALEKALTIFIDAGSGKTIVEGNPGSGMSCIGYPVESTTTLTDGAGAQNLLVFGNWTDLIWATFGNGLDVVVDPYSRAGSAQIVVTTNVFMDAAVRHPNSFTCSNDSAAQ